MLSVCLFNSEQNKHTACSILYAKYGYITHIRNSEPARGVENTIQRKSSIFPVSKE